MFSNSTMNAGYTGTLGNRSKNRKRSFGSSSYKSENRYQFLSLRGATALSGARYIRFAHPKLKTVWLSERECDGTTSEIHDLLGERGLRLFGKDAIEAINEKLPSVRSFEAEPLADRPGYTEKYFVTMGGTVIAPKNIDPVEAIFSPIPSAHALCGSLKGWRRSLEMIEGHSLPMFVCMLAATATMSEIVGLPLTKGFELVGSPGSHTMSLIKLAASFIGSTAFHPVPFKALESDVQGLAMAHRGTLMLINNPELALAGERPAKADLMLRDVLMPLSGDGRRSSPYLMVGTQSVVDRVGAKTDLGALIRQSLVTLTVPVERPTGVFPNLDGKSASAFAQRLERLAERNQGQAIARLARRLVKEMARTPNKVRNRAMRRRDEFLARSDVDLNDAAAVQEAEAFGLVYAAGCFGRDAGIFPESWKIGSAVLTCYNRYRVAPPPLRPIKDLLEELAADPVTVHLRRGQQLDRATIEAGRIFLRYGKKARMLMIRPEAMKQLNELNHRLHETSVRAVMPEAKAVKQRLQYGSKAHSERVFCFKMPTSAPAVEVA